MFIKTLHSNLPCYNVSICTHFTKQADFESRSCIIELYYTSQPTQASLTRLQDVLIKSRRLTTKQDVVTTSGKWRRIYDVLKTSGLRLLEDVQFTMSWRRLIYVVLKTSNLQRLEDVWFTTSSGRLVFNILKASDLWRLEDVLKQHLCSNVVATSIQRRKKWLFLILYCLKYSENFKCSSLS